jgi:hypothetical protein
MEAGMDDWSIPSWIKAVITFFACSLLVIFVRAILSAQTTLLGISIELIAVIALGLVVALVLIVIALWFFPDNAFTLFLYWLIRVFREQLSVFALLGIVYLITIRMPPFSVRGGIPLLNLIVLFLTGLYIQPVSLQSYPLPWMRKVAAALERLTDRINALPTLALSIAVALLPILIICSVIYVGLNAGLADYGPYSFWNDETGYWVWLRSFSYVDFNVGYNAPNELIAPAAFNHYGEGSPFYIYIYGGVGRLIGWSNYLPILINFAILALAIFSYVRLTKLNPVQILFVGLITTLTWPILLYLPMTSHETLNQALGFIMAIVFWRLLTRREQVSIPARFAFIALIYFATLIRLSWGLLLIPVIFYSLEGGVFRRILLSMVLGLGLYLSAVFITGYLVPPTNNSIFQNIKDSLVEGPQVLTNYIVSQFSEMFRFQKMNPNIAVMFQMLIIIGWNLIRLVRLIRTKLSVAAILQSQSVFEIYSMASLVAAGLLFYLQGAFYRTLTPSILVVYLLQVARKEYKLLAALLAINLLFFHSYMNFYAQLGDAEIIRADFTMKSPEQAQWQSDVEKWIAFDPAAETPWCNTLLIPIYYYDSRLMVIPPGIGISWISDIQTLQMPLRSKFLLLDPEAYQGLAGRANIQLLETLPIGDLYYNLESGCEFNPQH